MNKKLTLSIIIPAYNEEHYIGSCLDAIAAQTVAPDDVIVVDNNCTDNTIKIAKSYPFVRVIRESRQGRGYARTAGFNAAHTDIIGRIDVDSVLALDWVARVHDNFADDSCSAVGGLGKTAILPRIQWPQSVLWSLLYMLWSTHLNGIELMWGANMALRRRVWLTVRDDVCNDDALVHEDQDLSFLVQAAGVPIRRDNHLLMHTDGQTFHYFPKLWHYTSLRWMTKHRHVKSGAYARIPKQFSWRYRSIGFVVAPLLLVSFFMVSFLLWPLDLLIRGISRPIFRTT